MKLLFLCTGNSARSILTEAITRSQRTNALSAASELSGQFNPLPVEFLERHRVDTYASGEAMHVRAAVLGRG
ncbi:MAG: hypothetical protein MK295_04215 [Pseudomonadales bacterium]|nr:hypothetical protein [Gammaproteobacteria bacterium]MCH2353614.1 hypothetical protein [Pseudomonadales bacterium]MED5554842.1 hypothetical protein [Pseudomonadota bacterium]MBN85045.1 hypothetical protein [Gammaproteobacteria bacterium]MCS5569301.1 hypothetical protein [Pseudomonadales bacterium]